MHDGLDPATRWDIVTHESLGVLVFVLTLLRLVWVALRPARPRFEMAGWMSAVSHLVHGLLWLLMLAVPVTAMLALERRGPSADAAGRPARRRMPFIAQSALAPMADWGEVHGLLGDIILNLAGAAAAASISPSGAEGRRAARDGAARLTRVGRVARSSPHGAASIVRARPSRYGSP